MPAFAPTRPQARPAAARVSAPHAPQNGAPKPEPKILFQKYFKSVGPRTYAVQVKEAANGNHFIVLTEGRPDEKTGEVRKTRLFVFSEDFAEFLDLVSSAGEFTRANPLPDEVRRRQADRWSKAKGAPYGTRSSKS